MATGDKYPVLMASQLGSANGPAQLNSSAVLPVIQGGTEEGSTQQAIYNIGCGARSNLLNNWDFTNPINQNGETQYVDLAAKQICIDRWFAPYSGSHTNVSLSSQGVSIGHSDGSRYGWLKQNLENELQEGETYSISVLTSDGYLKTINGVASSGGSVIVYLDSQNNCVRISGLSSIDIVAYTTITLSAIKVEIGSNQTLAYQDSGSAYHLLPQPYRNELNLCQEYQLVTKNTEYTRANYITTNTIYFSLPAPATLQSNPTFSGTMQVFDFSSGSTQTGFTFSCYAYPGEIHIVATKTSHGLTDATLLIPPGVFDSNI